MWRVQVLSTKQAAALKRQLQLLIKTQPRTRLTNLLSLMLPLSALGLLCQMLVVSPHSSSSSMMRLMVRLQCNSLAVTRRPVTQQQSLQPLLLLLLLMAPEPSQLPHHAPTPSTQRGGCHTAAAAAAGQGQAPQLQSQ